MEFKAYLYIERFGWAVLWRAAGNPELDKKEKNKCTFTKSNRQTSQSINDNRLLFYLGTNFIAK